MNYIDLKTKIIDFFFGGGTPFRSTWSFLDERPAFDRPGTSPVTMVALGNKFGPQRRWCVRKKPKDSIFFIDLQMSSNFVG